MEVLGRSCAYGNKAREPERALPAGLPATIRGLTSLGAAGAAKKGRSARPVRCDCE